VNRCGAVLYKTTAKRSNDIANAKSGQRDPTSSTAPLIEPLRARDLFILQGSALRTASASMRRLSSSFELSRVGPALRRQMAVEIVFSDVRVASEICAARACECAA
jgi:hypothetical protein